MKNEINFPQSKKELIQKIKDGINYKYLYFWGHQSKKGMEVGKECLSQWYIFPFMVDNIVYPTAEHFMMAEKARLFQDKIILNKILSAEHPGEAKLLGRQVFNFHEQVWLDHRLDIAFRGNIAKFQQNKPLCSFLLNTANRILVEASPVDKIWGIGLSEDQPDALIPASWPGLNLLGFTLIKVRSSLRIMDQ